ncbi:uncharacterized protein JCM6883_004441 [Sporobolomyces salmoneus]|uniref:uncharacterized protein n=1 Tax=Sporobolomyces salmoneus TaxID=183962 RepID=UPI003170F7E2
MTSITTLGYGLTVRATDLLTAAQAWPRIEPTFRFLDLILRRKAKGTLASRGKMEGLVELVPVEVWEAIREWAVMLEMEEQEDRFLDHHARPCDDLEDFDSRLPDKISWDYLRREGVPDYFDDSEFYDTIEAIELGMDHVYQPLHRLVAAFGLSHPLKRVITFDSEDDYRVFDSVALVTIPSEIKRSDSTYTTFSAQTGNGDEPDEHNLVDVSLDLPSNADLRFLRFVRTFRLKVVETNSGTLQCVAPKPQRNFDREGKMPGMRFDRTRVVEEIKPRWRLYTSCYHEF